MRFINRKNNIKKIGSSNGNRCCQKSLYDSFFMKLISKKGHHKASILAAFRNILSAQFPKKDKILILFKPYG